MCLVLPHVVGLPIIHTHPSDQHVRLHSTARFNCNAIGNGTLTYSWSKGGIKIRDNAQHIEIKDVQVSNSGIYQCHVRNQDNLIAASMTAQLLGMFTV